MSYIVAAVDEDYRPLANVRVEAVDLANYIVDSSGGGTHLTLGETAGALAQAITDATDRSIWMANSETLTRAEDISALTMNKHISVHAAEGHRVTLTAKASTSMFTIAPTGTEWTAAVWGMCGMDFRNIYLLCDGAGDIFDINDDVGGNALVTLDNCFIDGRSLIDLAASKLAPSLWLRNCRNGTGTLVNIYTGTVSSTMDKLLIEDCELSVARVINAPYMPDETRVTGGELTCSDYFMQGQTVAWTELYVSGVWLIHSSATYAMFHTGVGALSIRDITIVSCYYQGTNASAVLGNFSSHAAAPCKGLTIVGSMVVNTLGGGTAITVDANWENVQVINNYRGWTTNYSGPVSTIWETLGIAKIDQLSVAGLTIVESGSKLAFFGATPIVRTAAYTITNVTPDRTYDADATAVAELADVLGTLIADLQAYGLLQ